MGVFLLILFIVNVVIALMVASETCGFSFVNPLVIYESVDVNWFGAIVLTIMANLLFPLISVFYWLYKLFTVGRK